MTSITSRRGGGAIRRRSASSGFTELSLSARIVSCLLVSYRGRAHAGLPKRGALVASRSRALAIIVTTPQALSRPSISAVAKLHRAHFFRLSSPFPKSPAHEFCSSPRSSSSSPSKRHHHHHPSLSPAASIIIPHRPSPSNLVADSTRHLKTGRQRLSPAQAP